MADDLRDRGKTLITDRDVEEMQCRWIRLAIHGELEALGAHCASHDMEFLVDFEVEGGLMQPEAPSNAMAAEQQAKSMIEA